MKLCTPTDSRVTPAHRFTDGNNYVPTNKWVLFGHHFAAISGAGPLIGPVLAQMTQQPTGAATEIEDALGACGGLQRGRLLQHHLREALGALLLQLRQRLVATRGTVEAPPQRGLPGGHRSTARIMQRPVTQRLATMRHQKR